MKVSEIPQIISLCQNFFKECMEFYLDFSSPWHFVYSNDKEIPFSSKPGIFFLCQTNESNWQKHIYESCHDILYIGLAQPDIQYAILQKFRTGVDDKFPMLGSPPFKNHFWKNLKIPEITEKIETGDLTLYSIKIDPYYYNLYVLYSMILNIYYEKNKKLPVLNFKSIEKNF
ncbi:MAG: hypothetical protein ACQESP_05325 [Candidatus Muiribacteriota bacterium]